MQKPVSKQAFQMCRFMTLQARLLVSSIYLKNKIIKLASKLMSYFIVKLSSLNLDIILIPTSWIILMPIQVQKVDQGA